MKKLISIICIFVLCFSICACGKTQGSEISIPEESISESSVPEQESEQESEPEPEPVRVIKNISEMTVKDLPELNGEEMTNAFLDARDNAVIKNRDFTTYIDNDTELAALLQKQEPIGENETWWLAGCNINALCQAYNAPENFPLESVETVIGQEVSFVRTNGEYRNDEAELDFIAMYTVFESEIGGYVYIWFDYYPENSVVFLKGVSYVDKPLSIADFEGLKADENSLDDVAKITHTVLRLQKDDWFSVTATFSSRMICTDGVVVINYHIRDTAEIESIYIHDSYTIPYSSEKDTAWINRNWTIHPDDFPPA